MSQYNLTLSIAPYKKRTNLGLKFQFLTTTKMTIFRHMLPCTVMEVDGRFRGAYRLSSGLWDYMAPHTKRQSFSGLTLQEINLNARLHSSLGWPTAAQGGAWRFSLC
jgi:hypothetical protein